ncbi:MAG: transposase [Ignavibacteriae bacterium]|nr:MAG: transposase [Ignavibacteriota bacterium]
MRSTYKILDKDGLYFVTSSIVNWIPIFNNEKYLNILFESIKFSQIVKGLNVFAYVFLFDHFHMIVTASDVKSIMQAIKGFTAREIIKELKKSCEDGILKSLQMNKKNHKVKSDYQVWQESYHPEIITSDYMFKQKVDYIHFNPVKHGYVKEPEDWKYSSYGYYYCDKESIIDIAEMEW